MLVGNAAGFGRRVPGFSSGAGKGGFVVRRYRGRLPVLRGFQPNGQLASQGR